jgi:hypothetical protein
MVAVPGLQNRLLILLIRFAPRSVVRKMAGKFNGIQD